MELRKGIGKAWAGWRVLLWLAAAPVAVHAATVYNGFTGPFAPANFQGVTNSGYAAFNNESTAIVISGPGGPGGLRYSSDVMLYNGPGNAGITEGPAIVQFHWQLDAGNSLGTEAFVSIYDSNDNLISRQTLGTTTYGGSTKQGDSQAYVPQFGYFVFGMNGMIYKGTAPTLNISSFVATIVPEASTWWAGGALLAFGAWRYWRLKRRQTGAASAPNQ